MFVQCGCGLRVRVKLGQGTHEPVLDSAYALGCPEYPRLVETTAPEIPYCPRLRSAVVDFLRREGL